MCGFQMMGPGLAVKGDFPEINKQTNQLGTRCSVGIFGSLSRGAKLCPGERRARGGSDTEPDPFRGWFMARAAGWDRRGQGCSVQSVYSICWFWRLLRAGGGTL